MEMVDFVSYNEPALKVSRSGLNLRQDQTAYVGCLVSLQWYSSALSMFKVSFVKTRQNLQLDSLGNEK